MENLLLAENINTMPTCCNGNWNQYWGSVRFWCGCGSADPYLWLMDPAPDPTPFFSDLEDAKKIIFFLIFFLITYPQAHYLESYKLVFCQNFCVKILFCKHYFSPLNTFMRKGKDLDPDPDPYLWLMDPEGPKICRSGTGSGSPTLIETTSFFS